MRKQTSRSVKEFLVRSVSWTRNSFLLDTYFHSLWKGIENNVPKGIHQRLTPDWWIGNNLHLLKGKLFPIACSDHTSFLLSKEKKWPARAEWKCSCWWKDSSRLYSLLSCRLVNPFPLVSLYQEETRGMRRNIILVAWISSSSFSLQRKEGRNRYGSVIWHPGKSCAR